MVDEPLRVCLLSPLPPPYGGISHWTAMVSRYSSKRKDIQLHIINTAPRWRAIYDLRVWKRVIGGGIHLIYNIIGVFYSILFDGTQIIHINTAGQFGLFRDLSIIFCANLFRIPIIYHIRFGRIPIIAKYNTWEWKLFKIAMLKAHTVIAIDTATENTIIQNLPKVHVVTIPNFLNPRKMPSTVSVEKQERTVMFLGWVIPTKGLKELIDAWAVLKPKNWRLLIVGPGDSAYQNSLLATHSGLHVEFAGEKSHKEAMTNLAEADLFVLPSYSEGFPNAVLEAMILEKPIIATCVGAIPEMLAENCGLLIEPKDSCELVNALRQLIENDSLRHKMGSRAKKRALEKFTIDAIFLKYMDIWRSAVSKR